MIWHLANNIIQIVSRVDIMISAYTNGVLSVYTPPLPRADGRGGVNEEDYPMTTNLLSGKSYLTG